MCLSSFDDFLMTCLSSQDYLLKLGTCQVKTIKLSGMLCGVLHNLMICENISTSVHCTSLQRNVTIPLHLKMQISYEEYIHLIICKILDKETL